MANIPSTWKEIKTIEQLNNAIEHSKEKPTILFKHSDNCGISGMVKSNLVRDWNMDADVVNFYYIGLIKYREVSNAVETILGIKHESPQLLLLKNNKVTYESTHFDITFADIKKAIL